MDLDTTSTLRKEREDQGDVEGLKLDKPMVQPDAQKSEDDIPSEEEVLTAQGAKAASAVISRLFAKILLGIALIQEPGINAAG